MSGMNLLSSNLRGILVPILGDVYTEPKVNFILFGADEVTLRPSDYQKLFDLICTLKTASGLSSTRFFEHFVND